MPPAADRRTGWRQMPDRALRLAALGFVTLGCSTESAPAVTDSPPGAAAEVAAQAPTSAPAPAPMPPVSGPSDGVRHLTFSIGDDDQLHVIDAGTATTLVTFEPAQGGFVRGLVPMLEQDRRVRRLDPAAPYQLDRNSAGQLRLVDPLSDTQIDLAAFGPDAVALFTRLLSVEVPSGATP